MISQSNARRVNSLLTTFAVQKARVRNQHQALHKLPGRQRAVGVERQIIRELGQALQRHDRDIHRTRKPKLAVHPGVGELLEVLKRIIKWPFFQ